MGVDPTVFRVSGASRLRRAMMAGAAVSLFAAPALAADEAIQTAPPPLPAPIETPAVPDGLGENGVYLDADVVTRDGERGQVLAAEGLRERLLARFDGNTLRARRATYDLETKAATGEGEVELTDPDGNVIYASRLELDTDHQVGVAVDFAARLEGDAKLMAATAVRRSETVNELNYALFTPCPICDDEGNFKQPTFSVQARQVVQDQELRAILYRNAVFRVAGVPVFYLPVFWHPDPSVERASGFLVPRFDITSQRGLSYEQPYLFVVSPSEDWTISPQINTRVNPFLNLGWRRHFGDGIVTARAGYTYEEAFGDIVADGDTDEDHRGFLLASGRFDPAGPWRWGFTAERTSDKVLFDRYDTVDPYQDNGLYFGDSRRLISQIYAERQTERSYVSVAALAIQSLRLNPPGFAGGVFEDDGTIPLVAPLVDARWDPVTPVWGGRLRLRASSAVLERKDYVGAPTLSLSRFVPGALNAEPGLEGVDSRRATLQGEWRRVLISPAGLRYEPFVDARFDAYSIADLPVILGGGGVGDEGATITRGRVAAGLDVSWPLIRRFEDADLVIEPMAQLLAATNADNDPRIPNEDAQAVEVEESTLFRVDRFAGKDLFEGGLRATLGARASLRWTGGRNASLFVGRSSRDEAEPAFRTAIPDRPGRTYDPTGLGSRASDWVVQATFSPTERIRGWGHAQVDDSGTMRRAEATVDAGWGRRNLASLNYILDRTNPVPGPLNRNYEFVQVSGQQFVWNDWGVVGRAVGDLETDTLTRAEAGLLYEDDCLRFEIGYRRDNTRLDLSGPRTGVFVRLTLATFGGSGYQPDEMR